jgi:hypothetical protein
MGEYHPGVILVWCVIASSGDYISRWSLMRRADDIIIETIIHYIQTAYVHAIMSRTTVAGECLLNIIHHTAARGLSWICITIAQPTHKANCDTQAEIGVVVGRKNNRQGRLLNTLINSNNEVINEHVTFARNEQIVSLRQKSSATLKISAIVSKHTKRIAPDYWGSECGPSWIPSDHIRVMPN